MPVLASTFFNLLLGATVVGAAAVAGLMAYYYVQARLREQRGVSIEGPTTAELVADAESVRAERAQEITQIRERIELLMEQQQLQSETQSQHLVQKLDELKMHVGEQGRQVSGLRGEFRHEMSRRDAEIDELRQQLATALDAFWKATPALAAAAPLALPPAHPGFEGNGHDPNGYGAPGSDGAAASGETWHAAPTWGAVETEPAPQASWTPFGADEPAPAPAAAPPTWGATDAWTAPDAADPAAPSPAHPAWGDTSGWAASAAPPLDAAYDETPADGTPAVAPFGAPTVLFETPGSEAAAPSWTLLDSDAPTAAGTPPVPSDAPTFAPDLPAFAPFDRAFDTTPDDESTAFDDEPAALVPEAPSLAVADEPSALADAPAFAPAPTWAAVPDEDALPVFAPLAFEPDAPAPAAPELEMEEPEPAEIVPLAAPPADASAAALEVHAGFAAPDDVGTDPDSFAPETFAPETFASEEVAPTTSATTPSPAFAPVDDFLARPADEPPVDLWPSAPAPEPAASEPVASAQEASQPVLEEPTPAPAALTGDDLTAITGVDTPMQARLYALGVTTLDEMARWSRADARRVSAALDVPEDTIMHHWIFEAQSLLFEHYQRQMARQARPAAIPA